MWVDVVSLRHDGAKLPPEAVRAATPLRARLTVDTVVIRGQGDLPSRAEVAHLWEDAGRERRLLGALECARVSRIGGNTLLVVGVETGGGGGARPQAWWCRIVLGPGDAPLPEWRDTWPGSLPAPLTDIVAVPPASTAPTASAALR
jgi:hypothetical protein